VAVVIDLFLRGGRMGPLCESAAVATTGDNGKFPLGDFEGVGVSVGELA
jgi:hypothetical protein